MLLLRLLLLPPNNITNEMLFAMPCHAPTHTHTHGFVTKSMNQSKLPEINEIKYVSVCECVWGLYLSLASRLSSAREAGRGVAFTVKAQQLTATN